MISPPVTRDQLDAAGLAPPVRVTVTVREIRPMPTLAVFDEDESSTESGGGA